MKIIKLPPKSHECGLDDPSDYKYGTVVECAECSRQYIRKTRESGFIDFPAWVRKFWRIK